MRDALLICNADDLGKTRDTTDAILSAFEQGYVTSTTAMVFAEDSVRAAGLAVGRGLPVGLHLNLTEPFTDPAVPWRTAERQRAIACRMSSFAFARWLLWPDLVGPIRRAVRDQVTEFFRLFGGPPTHVDGHHHIHVSANVLLAGGLPRGVPMRNAFTFLPGESGLAPRLVRRGATALIRRAHPTTDAFVDAARALGSPDALRGRVAWAGASSIEVECHPGESHDDELLRAMAWADLRGCLRRGDFRSLSEDPR